MFTNVFSIKKKMNWLGKHLGILCVCVCGIVEKQCR